MMRTAGLGLAALALLLPGCSMAIGGAVGAVVVSAGVLASGCYDHVDVTLRTPAGERVCDARIVATSDGSEVELVPCWSAVLPAGTWQIRAEHAGQVAQSTLIIPEDRECGRLVHRIDLTLGRQAPTISETAPPIRSSASTSSTTPISTAALGMP
jgi:hypothetical protein